ncbi:MAG: hypothetical protein R6V23_03570 [Bacteroidales bacterium]
MTISKGSVGKYRLTGIEGKISSNLTDKGVKNTTVSKILSREIKLAKIKSKITGKKAI